MNSGSALRYQANLERNLCHTANRTGKSHLHIAVENNEELPTKGCFSKEMYTKLLNGQPLSYYFHCPNRMPKDLKPMKLTFKYEPSCPKSKNDIASFNAVDLYGRTPLHLAALRNNVKWANFCIQNGADLDIKDKVGKSPIEYAEVFLCENVRALLLKEKEKREKAKKQSLEIFNTTKSQIIQCSEEQGVSLQKNKILEKQALFEEKVLYKYERAKNLTSDLSKKDAYIELTLRIAKKMDQNHLIAFAKIITAIQQNVSLKKEVLKAVYFSKLKCLKLKDQFAEMLFEMVYFLAVYKKQQMVWRVWNAIMPKFFKKTNSIKQLLEELKNIAVTVRKEALNSASRKAPLMMA